MKQDLFLHTFLNVFLDIYSQSTPQDLLTFKKVAPFPADYESVRVQDCRFGSLCLKFSVIPHVLSPLSAYISLNAPLYPIPSSIYLPASVIHPLISALALLYSNSTLLTVSLIYLSSPFLKVITHTACFARLKQRPTERKMRCVISLPASHLIKHTHTHTVWMQMRTHTHGCRHKCMLL